MALVLSPAGGFAVLIAHCSPALSRTAPPIFTAEHFPVARIRGFFCAHEIESGDYSSLVAKDYFQKPLSNVASHSHGTTLYGTRA